MSALSTNVKMRQRIERNVAKLVLQALISHGYMVRIYDGEEFAGARTDNVDKALSQMFTTDDDTIYAIRRSSTSKTGWERFAWVHMVYGNDGYDVTSDYSVNLEEIMRPIQEKIEAWNQGENHYGILRPDDEMEAELVKAFKPEGIEPSPEFRQAFEAGWKASRS